MAIINNLFELINIIFTFIIWGIILYGLVLFIKQKINNFANKQPIELRIYLDDERPKPKDWVLVRNYKDCIEILEAFSPSHLSLDHDLGEEKTGYDVINWIEEKTFNDPKYNPPIITVHSANPAGRQNMERGIKSIQKILSNRQ